MKLSQAIMHKPLLLIVLTTFPLVLHAADQTDAQLTKLMVGGWRSPRHGYTYLADGTWYMGRTDSGSWHGRWQIKEHHLLRSSVSGDDEAPTPTEDDGLIQKLNHREILFGGIYRMQRIKVSQVEL